MDFSLGWEVHEKDNILFNLLKENAKMNRSITYYDALNAYKTIIMQYRKDSVAIERINQQIERIDYKIRDKYQDHYDKMVEKATEIIELNNEKKSVFINTNSITEQHGNVISRVMEFIDKLIENKRFFYAFEIGMILLQGSKGTYERAAIVKYNDIASILGISVESIKKHIKTIKLYWDNPNAITMNAQKKAYIESKTICNYYDDLHKNNDYIGIIMSNKNNYYMPQDITAMIGSYNNDNNYFWFSKTLQRIFENKSFNRYDNTVNTEINAIYLKMKDWSKINVQNEYYNRCIRLYYKTLNQTVVSIRNYYFEFSKQLNDILDSVQNEYDRFLITEFFNGTTCRQLYTKTTKYHISKLLADIKIDF